MFNQNSFSIDSGNNPNNSFNFNSPQKRVSNQSDSFKNNQDDYDFGVGLANYNFRQVTPTVNINKPIRTSDTQLRTQPRVSKQNMFNKIAIQQPNNKPLVQQPFNKKPNEQRTSFNMMMDKISQKPSQTSLSSDESKPRGLLKQKMKVDYAFDHKNIAQSQIIRPSKPVSKFPNYSQVNRSEISANLFSCMDAPQYQRDFEISPKVIARKYY